MSASLPAMTSAPSVSRPTPPDQLSTQRLAYGESSIVTRWYEPPKRVNRKQRVCALRLEDLSRTGHRVPYRPRHSAVTFHRQLIVDWPLDITLVTFEYEALLGRRGRASSSSAVLSGGWEERGKTASAHDYVVM
jgi:hypothetical protein